MPFKRGRTYYVDVKPPGYSHRIALSTRATAKATALQMEATLRGLATDGRHDLLDRLRAGDFGLPDLHAAKANGKLADLASNDPPLSDAVQAFTATTDDRRYHATLAGVLEAAPRGARLSWLDTDTLRTLLRNRLDNGIELGTVHRDRAAISCLLRHHYGEAKRREIMAGLKLKSVRDGRIRWLSRDEIGRLRDISGDWWLVWALLLSTGIRRGELLGLRVEDFDGETSQLRVWGTKSKASERVVPLSGEIVALLRGWIAANELGQADPLFPEVNKWAVDRAWRACCSVAGITGCRLHDLRHTFAVHAVKSAMLLPELQRRLDHARMDMTWRYASFAPLATSEHLNAALDRMGLSGSNTAPNTTEKMAVQSHSDGNLHADATDLRLHPSAGAVFARTRSQIPVRIRATAVANSGSCLTRSKSADSKTRGSTPLGESS